MQCVMKRVDDKVLAVTSKPAVGHRDEPSPSNTESEISDSPGLQGSETSGRNRHFPTGEDSTLEIPASIVGAPRGHTGKTSWPAGETIGQVSGQWLCR